MSEKHDRGTFEQGVKREQKEGLSEYALCLYSDFALPELGEPKRLGRVLDEEIYVSLNYDSNDKGPDRRPSYWIGNNDTAGWRELTDAEPSKIWEVFEEVAKHKLWLEALSRRGGDEATNYWYQKFVNRREPGSDEWKRIGNPRE